MLSSEGTTPQSTNPSDLVKHRPEELPSEIETDRSAAKRAKLDGAVNKI